jgi:hypothetical protein
MMAILLEGHDSEDTGLGVASWSSEPSTPARSPFISSSWALAANDDLERTWDGIGEGAMLSREYAIFNAIVAYAILATSRGCFGAVPTSFDLADKAYHTKIPALLCAGIRFRDLQEASKNLVVDLLVVYHVLTVLRRNIHYIYLVKFSSRLTYSQ